MCMERKSRIGQAEGFAHVRNKNSSLGTHNSKLTTPINPTTDHTFPDEGRV